MTKQKRKLTIGPSYQVNILMESMSCICLWNEIRMTKFYFVIYGIIHAGDKIEAKSFLQEIVKEGQFEHNS